MINPAIFAALMLAAGAAMADGAELGVAADAASTAVALSMPGMVESNPLGAATVPIRLAIIEEAKRLPPEKGVPVIHGVGAASWGAAANNIMLALGAGPAAIPAAIFVGLGVWASGADEREFYAQCRMHERLAGHPLTCVYARP